jgi:hypothetical protein
MRAFILAITILITQFNSANAQSKVVLDGPTRINTAGPPLVLVDTLRTDLEHLIISPEKIEAIHIYKDSVAISKFGDAGKFGVVLIHPKADTKFLRMGKILDNSTLPIEDKKLRICINKNLVQDPQLILIENSEIESVEVTTERHWINSEDTHPGERFINITTRTKRAVD